MFRRDIKYPEGYEHISLESDRSDYTPQVGERNYVEARVPQLAPSEGDAVSDCQIEEGPARPGDEEELRPNATGNLSIAHDRPEEEKKESAPPAKICPAAPASRPVLSNLIDRLMNFSYSAKKSPSMISQDNPMRSGRVKSNSNNFFDIDGNN